MLACFNVWVVVAWLVALVLGVVAGWLVVVFFLVFGVVVAGWLLNAAATC